MEVKLESRSFILGESDFLLLPRLECITRSLDLLGCSYELLTSVISNNEFIDSRGFFEYFPIASYYSYLRDVFFEISSLSLKGVSINISGDFLNSPYLDFLLSEFSALEISLEIDEQVIFSSNNMARFVHVTNEFNSEIWLDDFGTGTANFDSINKYRYDAIKISKELFWKLFTQDLTLLRHLVNNLRSCSNKVIVEGVDSFDKYIFCRELNLLMQGYFFKEYQESKAAR